ncbi:MAG: thiamine phosphate synthase [Desulfuromonadales bacterium]|nr:MAG: thiamine phosphate synthase [Desulfuromonadales bacterium]
MNRVDFTLYLITDRHQTGGRPLPDVIEETLKGGVRAVQLREKDLSPRELLDLARTMREVTARHGARLFINDRVDIALASGADGVHLGEASIPADEARKILGPDRFIGVSCHSHDGALAAQDAGADFITFGPVYPTPTKAAYGDPVGLEQLTEAAQLLRIPVFALGGIKKSNANEVVAAGAAGIALISAIISADSPQEEALALLSLLKSR